MMLAHRFCIGRRSIDKVTQSNFLLNLLVPLLALRRHQWYCLTGREKNICAPSHQRPVDFCVSTSSKDNSFEFQRQWIAAVCLRLVDDKKWVEFDSFLHS